MAIVIDIYKPQGHKAVCLQGKVAILDNGEEFKEIYKIFFKKFKWVRDDPWTEKEAPILKILVDRKKSWGLDDKKS